MSFDTTDSFHYIYQVYFCIMSNCLFCKIIAGEIPCHKVYEDSQIFGFLDIGPVSRGHLLLVPKLHSENLSADTAQDAGALMQAAQALGRKAMQALGATGYNLGMNHGESAGQDVFHTHLHLMPRYEGQTRSFVKTHPSQEELAEVAALLCA